jgi:hypothetical protein
MSILTLIIGLVVIIIAFWAVNTYLPTDPPLRLIANIVLVVILILVVLAVFGLLDGLSTPMRYRSP